MKSTILRDATSAEAIKLGLTKVNFEAIKKILGRVPTIAEINIYGIVWSEVHSSNNFGIVELNKKMNCLFKVDSNRSRDLTSPNTSIIAQMNSFSFGSLENSISKTTIKNITKETSEAGNRNKTPTFEGDVLFDQSFDDNPLVNTFSVELIDSKNDISESNQTLFLNSSETINAISNNLELEPDNLRIEIENQNARYFNNDKLIAELPLDSLLNKEESKLIEGEFKEPAYFQESKEFDINSINEPNDLKEVASFLLKHPNIASKRWINEQFNSMKRTGVKKTNAFSDAGIIEIKDTDNALVMNVNGNSRYVKSDPEIGTSIAIAEASRNIICAGGEPIAISICLNFGNITNPEIQWQYNNVMKGLSTASKKFETPIADKITSFNNHTYTDGKEVSIAPTPTIGMIGLLEDKNKAMSFDFKTKGDLIFIIGEAVECIASSEYLISYHGVKESPAPYFNLNMEYEMQKVIKSLIKNDLINAAHDCSRGGIFITLTEMAMPNELGFDIVTDAEIREDAFLFGEAAGRVLVAVNEESEDGFIEFLMNTGVNFTLLGHVTQGKLVVDDDHYGFIQSAKKSYNKALENLIV